MSASFSLSLSHSLKLPCSRCIRNCSIGGSQSGSCARRYTKPVDQFIDSAAAIPTARARISQGTSLQGHSFEGDPWKSETNLYLSSFTALIFQISNGAQQETILDGPIVKSIIVVSVYRDETRARARARAVRNERTCPVLFERSADGSRPSDRCGRFQLGRGKRLLPPSSPLPMSEDGRQQDFPAATAVDYNVYRRFRRSSRHDLSMLIVRGSEVGGRKRERETRNRSQFEFRDPPSDLRARFAMLSSSTARKVVTNFPHRYNNNERVRKNIFRAAGRRTCANRKVAIPFDE